jgi:hypothetical protein
VFGNGERLDFISMCQHWVTLARTDLRFAPSLTMSVRTTVRLGRALSLGLSFEIISPPGSQTLAMRLVVPVPALNDLVHAAIPQFLRR